MVGDTIFLLEIGYSESHWWAHGVFLAVVLFNKESKEKDSECAAQEPQELF